MKRAILGLVCASALMGLGGGSCGSSSSYDYAYYDPYLYYGYYPADVYYSAYYWTDPYYYYYLEYNPGRPPTDTTGGGGSTGAAGSMGTGGGGGSTAAGDMTMGDVLRAMARGETVCPGQVTITPRMTADPCATDGSGMSRSGVTIQFNGCQIAGGSRYDGMIDVQSTQQLSDQTCAAGTMVTFMNTTTISNLTRTTPNGARIVIPSSTGRASTNYVAGQLPTSVSTMIDGSMQILGTNGNVTADRTFAGEIMLSPASDRASYTIDGTLTLVDAGDASTTMLTAAGLHRSDACCRPDAGMLTISRAGGVASGTHSWTFGPGCGAIMFDDKSINAPACM